MAKILYDNDFIVDGSANSRLLTWHYRTRYAEHRKRRYLLAKPNFCVGCEIASLVTPNFKVKEFFDRRGKIYIHRKLVAALQILRDRMGTAITIKQLEPAASLNPGAKGRCIVVGSTDAERLAKAGRDLYRDKYVSRVAAANGDLYLEMPDSAAMPVGPEYSCSLRKIDIMKAVNGW